jgi:hypothetical protein
VVLNGAIELARRVGPVLLGTSGRENVAVEAARRESVVDVDTLLGGGQEPRERAVVTPDLEACLVSVATGLDTGGTLAVFLRLGKRPDGASDFLAFFGVGLKKLSSSS